MASDAGGEGEPGERWSAWRGGGIITGEREPVERSDPPAGPGCDAAARAGGSDGPETSGVTNPTWRILGSTPPDVERGGRRRSMAVAGARSRSRVWGLDTTHETGRVGICPAVVEQGGRLWAFCWTRSMTVRPILYGPCWARDQADYSFSVKFCWAKRKVHELYREIIITVPCDFARKNTKGQKVRPWSWGFSQKAWCHGTVMWFYKMMTQKRMMENLNNHYKLFEVRHIFGF
jgi:hypothetical protein